MQLGPTLALFTRSIREENRSKFSYTARLLLVLIVFVFLWAAYENFTTFSGSPGLKFFRTLTYINAIFITLAGVAFFSTSITEEKEEQTLGLLRMTKLSPVAILLGKSTSRLFGAGLLILAQLPFTLLAISLGGVTQTQVFAVYASLLAWIFFIANLALFCSVVRARNSGATGLTIGLLIMLYIIPGISAFVLFQMVNEGVISPMGSVARFAQALGLVLIKCEFISQIGRILNATGYSGSIFSFQVGACLVVGSAFFFLSWAFFNTFNREQKEPTPGRGIVGKIKSEKKPGFASGVGRLFSPPRVGAGAIFWKDFHFFRGGWLGMLIRLGTIALVLGVIVMLANPRGTLRVRDVGGILLWVGLLVGMLDISLGAGRIFASEGKWKTLSSLSMLPVNTGGICYQKIAALLLSALPYFVVVLIGLGMIGENAIEDVLRFIFHPAGMYTIATFILCLHLTALFSLIVKGGALVALIVSAAIVFLGNLLMLWIVAAGRIGPDEGILIFFVLCVGGLCVYLQFAIARRLESLAATE